MMLRTKMPWSFRAAAALATLACLAPLAHGGEEVRLKGKAITLAEHGFGAVPRQEAGVVALLSKPIGASAMLPYSKRWRFVIEDDGRITGEDDDHAFTLTAAASSAETERAYLGSIVERLEGGAIVLRGVELVDVGDDVVLRYQSRPASLPPELASLDPWWWHYWSAQARGTGWLDVHLSILEPDEDLPANDTQLITMLARGLRALPVSGS